MADYSSVVTKSGLQERLLSAVKECQKKFGGKQEMATEDDDAVATLCAEWEAIMMHGLPCGRVGKGKSRKMPHTRPRDSELGFWAVVKANLSQSELERYHSLKHVNTDIGYGRAWLRCCINERSLENYLHQILSNVSLLKSHYESHAYLLDEERSAMLTNMAAGLTAIIFSINYDSEALNHVTGTHTPPEAAQIMEPVVARDDQFKAVSVRKKKKKPKKHEEDEEDGKLFTPEPAEDSVLKGRPSDLSLSEGDSAPHIEGSNHSSTHSSFSGEVEESTHQPMVALYQPESSDTEGDLTTQAQMAYRTTEMVIKATNEGMNHTGGHNIKFSGEMRTNRTSSVGHSHSASELKQALLAMVRRKEEMERERDEVKVLLEQERTEVSQLMEQITVLQMEIKGIKEDHLNKEEALKRENTVLRDQLKKYVSLVQAQRKETIKQSSVDETEATSKPSSTSPRQSPPPLDPSAENMPNLYPKTIEHKLAEMAEMYGELMELNDRLHRELAEKEAIVQRLSQQMQSRGISVTNVPPQLASSVKQSLRQQQIVQIAIPSVIRKGRGADSHHVYQVYIKVKQDEWNIYRRYAEFNEFHRQIRKTIPEAASFEFPPKKTLGRKSSELVEMRRLRLQEYLQFIIRLCSTGGDKRPVYIRPAITKLKFIKILPFFKEDLTTISESLTPTSPSYSGL